MFVDDTDYPSWLKLRHYPVDRRSPSNLVLSSKSQSSATAVPELLQIARCVSFHYWSDVDKEVKECRDYLNALEENNVIRISIGEEVSDLNVARNGNVGASVGSIGAEDVANEFGILLMAARRAARVPSIFKDLRCDPRTIISKSNTTVLWPSSVVGSSSKTASRHIPAVVVRDVKPDICLYEPMSTGEVLRLALEAKRPSVKYSDIKIKRFVGPYVNVRGKDTRRCIEKSGPLHAVLQNLFSRTASDWAGLTVKEKVAALAVAQSVVYAIHTSTGCSILSTFDETFFMKVNITKSMRRKNWSIQVHVSRLYGASTVICGLVGCLKYVFSTTHSTDWEKRLQLMQYLDPNGSGREGARKTAKQKRNAGKEAKKTTKKKQKEQRSRSGQKSRSKHMVNYVSAARSAHQVEIDATISELIEFSNSAELFQELNADEVYSILTSNSGFICVNGYNKILKCEFDGNPVVAKYFCSLDERREISTIEEELAMHEFVADRCEEGDYGDFVSKVVAYGYLPSFGMVLFIEYVGQPVENLQGFLKVGDQKIEDTESLTGAAVTSLKRLHALGVSHGDIALRNMRAELGIRGEWQVWWLDLGRAEESEVDETFNREVLECRALFRVDEAMGL